jgi:hypothetical protein
MNHQLQYHPTSLFLLLQRVELLLVQYHPLIAVRHPWLLLPWSKQFKALKQTMTAPSPTATTGNREIVNPNLQSPKTFWEKKPACFTKNTNTFWKELYTSRNDMKMECKQKFTKFFFLVATIGIPRTSVVVVFRQFRREFVLRCL